MALVGWLVVELVAPGMAEERIELRVRNESGGATGVEADVDSFPLLTRVILTGRVARTTVEMTEVVRRRITFARIAFVFEEVRVDRSAFLMRDARVRSIERGTVSARISSEELSAIFGVAQRIGLEGLEVRASDGVLRVGRSGLGTVAVDLPDVLFPCDPDATIGSDGIILSCAFDEVPAVLVGRDPPP